MPHGRFVCENPDGAIQAEHLMGQVLRDNRRLIAGLNEEIGREQALRALFEHH
jgi:hypothetical protein